VKTPNISPGRSSTRQIGAFLGSIAGSVVLLRFDKWSALYQLIPMYDGAESI
jgi:hypothetical protein